MVFTVLFVVCFVVSVWFHSISTTVPRVTNASYAGLRMVKKEVRSFKPIILKYVVIYTTYLFVGWWVVLGIVVWKFFRL